MCQSHFKKRKENADLNTLNRFLPSRTCQNFLHANRHFYLRDHRTLFQKHLQFGKHCSNSPVLILCRLCAQTDYTNQLQNGSDYKSFNVTSFSFLLWPLFSLPSTSAWTSPQMFLLVFWIHLIIDFWAHINTNKWEILNIPGNP